MDLESLPPDLRAVVVAAMDLDRNNLENVEVHPCDRNNVEVRRQHLYDEARALSDALARAGLLLPSTYFDAP